MSAPVQDPDLHAEPARERFTISARRYRAVTLFALVMLVLIIITGAGVRLTESGLGCEDWPNCSEGELIQFGSPNQSIEQINRLITGLVSASVIAAVLGSLRRRPYRRDLVWWSVSLVAGVLGQIVLGGITVLVDLHPAAVAAHFVLSQVLVACAVTLVWRARQEPGPRHVRVDRTDLTLSRLALAGATVLMFTGPAVTGSGPHAGDARAERFGWFIPDVVRVHSINMWIFLAVVVVLLVRMARRGAPADIQRRGRTLLAVIVAQGAIGYTQYELGIPEWLVLLHIAGATAVVALVVWFHLGLSAPDTAAAPGRDTDAGAPLAGATSADGSHE
jgi:cytochrome c oxidase assembly protein subunit 15